MENKRHLIQDIYYPKPLNKPTPYPQYHPNPNLHRLPQQAPPQQPHSTPQPTKSKSKLIFAFFGVLAISVGAGFLIKTNLAGGGNQVIDSPRVKAAAIVEEVPAIDYAGIEAQINAVISRYPSIQISVAYTDIKTTTKVKAGVQEPYLAASTAKLLTAVLFLQEVQNGKYRLDTKVGGAPASEQLRKMIENSDNASWEAFDRLLTGRALESFALSTGLLNYDSGRNTTTPTDIALLLEKLYKNQLLDQPNTELLLSYLQNASERQYISAGLPAVAKVYHKAGYLKDRAHDAAIVDNGQRPFVLVIFTKSNGSYDFALGQKIMHEITSVVRPAYNL